MAGIGRGADTTLGNTMRINKVGRAAKDEDEEEDELAMPMVTSDVLRLPQLRTERILSSMMVGSPQTPGGARMSQQTSAEPLQSPSRMQLAVHIKSSPVTPFTPINAPATRDPSTLPSRLSRIRGQTTRSKTPIRAPTPDPLADLGTEVETPSSSGPRKRGRPRGWKPGMPYSTDPNSRYRKREMRAAESRDQAQSPGQSKVEVNLKRQNVAAVLHAPQTLQNRQFGNSIYNQSQITLYTNASGTYQKTRNNKNRHYAQQNYRTWIRYEDTYLLFMVMEIRYPPLRFKTEKEFQSHMETKHFAGYLWYLGEGCQNNGIWTLKNKPANLPAYLFDKHGNQVTPSVEDQRLESDLQYKERKRKLRKLIYQQNENAPSEEEWIKQMLGIA